MTKMEKLDMFVVKHSQDPNYCYEHDFGIPGRFDVFAAEFDFVTDAFPSRESKSIFGETYLQL